MKKSVLTMVAAAMMAAMSLQAQEQGVKPATSCATLTTATLKTRMRRPSNYGLASHISYNGIPMAKAARTKGES
jgi:hypothetical protein